MTHLLHLIDKLIYEAELQSGTSAFPVTSIKAKRSHFSPRRMNCYIGPLCLHSSGFEAYGRSPTRLLQHVEWRLSESCQLTACPTFMHSSDLLYKAYTCTMQVCIDSLHTMYTLNTAGSLIVQRVLKHIWQ